jgi:hypothetical protein
MTYVRAYIQEHTCVHVLVLIHTRTHMCTCACLDSYKNTHVHMCLSWFIQEHTCAHVLVLIHTRTHMCTCACLDEKMRKSEPESFGSTACINESIIFATACAYLQLMHNFHTSLYEGFHAVPTKKNIANEEEHTTLCKRRMQFLRRRT